MPFHNEFTGIGNLTRQPALGTTKAGKPKATFTIAINTGFGDNEKTMFLDCLCLGGWATRLAENSRGHVFVKGELTQDTWETDNGEKRSKIKLLCVAPNHKAFAFDPRKSEGEQAAAPGGSVDINQIDDPDIPF